KTYGMRCALCRGKKLCDDQNGKATACQSKQGAQQIRESHPGFTSECGSRVGHRKGRWVLHDGDQSPASYRTMPARRREMACERSWHTRASPTFNTRPISFRFNPCS